ncbi:serine protease FAM111A [Echinops telfairi]|uniref:Serine protease FAM111A n=1 Tax=Echinops telfairi TaxID=9371 RepID=A0ABM1VLY6_ECHTE|nr:serine protease FAM111A [Echinops telfairi]
MTDDTQARRSHSPWQNPEDLVNLTITLNVNCKGNENRKHTLRCKKTDSLYEALNSLKAVQNVMKVQPDKEMLVCGTDYIKGYLNLGMPLSCIPEGSHLEIKFVVTKSKQGNQIHHRLETTVGADCIKFNISAIGKEKRRIVKCNQLHIKGSQLCVYAFKGETIKDALYKDGRFLSFLEKEEWKLIENLELIIENTQPVDELEGRLFELEVEKTRRKTSPQRAISQNSESVQRTASVLNTQIMDQYPSLEKDSKKITEYLNKEIKDKRKKNALFKLHKENFGKLVSNSTTMREHKNFVTFGEGVGRISWNNNGNTGSATGFVYREPFIFTCRHVTNCIVGEGIEPSRWADVISASAWMTFDDDEEFSRFKRFTFEPWFEVSDVALDYAVLKLKIREQKLPLELCDRKAQVVPLNGLLHIIGYPDGKEKSTDNCCMIPLSCREEACKNRIDAGEALGHNIPYVFLQTENSFKPQLDDSNVITYDTSFYFGSSGSPVFNSSFELVAMHTAGFSYKYLNGISSVIEFGYTMEAILNDIKQNHGEWYKTELSRIGQGDVEMETDED